MKDRLKLMLRKVGAGKMTVKEYQANLNGLNIFFGAVLGFVLAGTEQLTSIEFGIMLMILAAAVISILYITSSRHRIIYSMFALAVAYILPDLMATILDKADFISEKIRPTLIVWTLMTMAVEFWPKYQPEKTS